MQEREILFRGKTYDGKWEQGDLRHGGYVHNDSETYIMRADYALHNIPVDPKTVGQYTGLTDKNNKKIFEGDILYDEYNECNCLITFDEGSFCLVADNVCQSVWSCDMTAFEVIGNIHDNPELLEEKQ